MKEENPPYYLFGVPLHNKKVAMEFCMIFIAMLVVPILVFFGLQKYLEDSTTAGICSVVSAQAIIGWYIYLIVNDKENFNQTKKKVKQQ